MAKKLRIRRREGDIVAVPLADGTYGFGRVLHEPLMAFYDLKSAEVLSVEQILQAPIAFTIFVMNRAVTQGAWPVIGTAALDDSLLTEPLFFKKDAISNKLSIYRDSTGEEIPASEYDCKDLECAAVWDAEHVADRILDHFAGRPNKWVESLRP